MGGELGKGVEEAGKTSGVSGVDVRAAAPSYLLPRFGLTYWHSNIGNKVPVCGSKVAAR